MADISSIKLPDNSVYNIKDASALRDAPSDGALYGRKNGAWEVVPTGGGGGDSDLPYDILNGVYPVGSVVCMNTNTNPSTLYGGTWQLIDKQFSNLHVKDTTGTYFTKDNTYTNTFELLVYRAGHSLSFRLQIKLATAISTNASGMLLGTLNLSALGFDTTGGMSPARTFFWGGGTTGTLQATIAASGAVQGWNVTEGATIASGKTLMAQWTIVAPAWMTTDTTSYMDDSACDKFFFKRLTLADTSGAIALDGDTATYGS